MNTSAHKRATLLIAPLLLIGVLALTFGLWVGAEQRQKSLNRQLIDALQRQSIPQALALVKSGADPKAQVDPPPASSLPDLLNQLLFRAKPPTNNTPSAFQLSCGADWFSADGRLFSRMPDSPDLVEAMLERGVDINCRNFVGLTPLMLASYVNHRQTVKILLQHHALIDLQDPQGKTALECALEGRAIDAMQELLDNHADVNLCNGPELGGTTVLMEAVKVDPKYVSLLLAHGAAVDATSRTGMTALHYAAMVDRPESVRLLLKYHANLALKDLDGTTALTFASRLSQIDYGGKVAHSPHSSEIVRMLKQAGAKE